MSWFLQSYTASFGLANFSRVIILSVEMVLSANESFEPLFCVKWGWTTALFIRPFNHGCIVLCQRLILVDYWAQLISQSRVLFIEEQAFQLWKEAVQSVWHRLDLINDWRDGRICVHSCRSIRIVWRWLLTLDKIGLWLWQWSLV